MFICIIELRFSRISFIFIKYRKNRKISRKKGQIKGFFKKKVLEEIKVESEPSIQIIQHNHQLYKWIINVKNKQDIKYKEILFENPFCFYIA